MKNKNPPFQSEEKRFEVLRRLNEIPGIKLSPDCIGKYPTISLSTLSDGNALEQFLKLIAWTIQEVKAEQSRPISEIE